MAEQKEDLVKGKTRAQRIRAILFLHWRDKAMPKEDFEVYYKEEMERIIKLLKDVYL